jgi:hypothetical protein
VAQGYTAAAGGESTSQQLMARQRFARGMEFVRAYVTRVQAMQERGFIAPETASLLVDFGNILIARLEPLS